MCVPTPFLALPLDFSRHLNREPGESQNHRFENRRVAIKRARKLRTACTDRYIQFIYLSRT